MADTVTVVATVLEIRVDPELRDPVRRHLARVRVDEVVEGRVPSDRLTLLIHSPSRTFFDPDPLGSSFVITMTAPITDPYLGPLEISEDDFATDEGDAEERDTE